MFGCGREQASRVTETLDLRTPFRSDCKHIHHLTPTDSQRREIPFLDFQPMSLQTLRRAPRVSSVMVCRQPQTSVMRVVSGDPRLIARYSHAGFTGGREEISATVYSFSHSAGLAGQRLSWLVQPILALQALPQNRQQYSRVVLFSTAIVCAVTDPRSLTPQSHIHNLLPRLAEVRDTPAAWRSRTVANLAEHQPTLLPTYP
ncbi:hypothetical protein Bbelb_274990 [Branchiostoma belcheri]|nr:hypothetical protein Bbelb_274990 [Branchiostoma belcheri]